MRNPAFILILYCATWSLVFGELYTIDLDFFPAAGSSTIEVSASTGGSASDDLNYNGNFLATLTFDLSTLKANEIQFTGGEIMESSASYTFSSNVFYTGQGLFATTFKISTTGIKARYLSPNGPGKVNPDTGELVNSEHVLRAFDGKSSLEIQVLDQKQVEMQDFKVEPLDSPLTGSTVILIEKVHETLLKQTLFFRFIGTLDESESAPFAGTDATITIQETGKINGSTIMEVPTDFGAWVEEQDLTIETGEERNPFDMPYLLLYAFNLPHIGTSRDIPVKIRYENGIHYLEITPPSTGLRANLSLQRRRNLRYGIWEDISEMLISPPETALKKGSVDTVKVPFGAPYPDFLRLKVEL